MHKWSDHTSDKCPYCGGHTGNWASTYAFNFEFMECPFCSGLSQSTFVDMQEFQWVLPDWNLNKMHWEVFEILRKDRRNEESIGPESKRYSDRL